jgi:nucleoid-associated protein YgaU
MSTMTLDQLLETPRTATIRPVPAVRAERPRSTVRLTRRGRVVVFAAGLVALLGVGVLVSAGAGATLHPGTPESTHTVVVTPGDTLWDLAAEAAGGGDTRAMITHIEELNGLAGASLSAGQTLRIPN